MDSAAGGVLHAVRMRLDACRQLARTVDGLALCSAADPAAERSARETDGAPLCATKISRAEGSSAQRPDSGEQSSGQMESDAADFGRGGDAVGAPVPGSAGAANRARPEPVGPGTGAETVSLLEMHRRVEEDCAKACAELVVRAARGESARPEPVEVRQALARARILERLDGLASEAERRLRRVLRQSRARGKGTPVCSPQPPGAREQNPRPGGETADGERGSARTAGGRGAGSALPDAPPSPSAAGHRHPFRRSVRKNVRKSASESAKTALETALQLQEAHRSEQRRGETANVDYLHCELCGAPMEVLEETAELRCTAADCQTTRGLVGTVFSASQFFHYTAEGGIKSKSGSFKPCRHYQQWITRILALEPESELGDPEDPEDLAGERLLERMRAIVRRDRMVLQLLTVRDVRAMLQELGRTKLNSNTSLILKKLTGRGPPRLSEAVIARSEKIFNDANMVRREFLLGRDRMSRHYYPDYIRRILDHVLPAEDRESRRVLAYIHVQGDETTANNDREWRVICQYLEPIHGLSWRSGK